MGAAKRSVTARRNLSASTATTVHDRRAIVRHACGAFLLALAAALTSVSAFAQQSYPSKPIRLILPFPPGAPSDLVGRTIGQKLGEQMGQSFVPDNRAGAGGSVGLAMVAKAPPDGYTVLVASPAIALTPLLYSNLSYDVTKDFSPIARLASIENVMLVHPSVPVKTLKEFIALARAQPGKLNYGSGGPGTTNHLANELLKSLEKINLVHVPYKGATLATTALMGGEVDQVIVSVASVLPLIKAGRVRPIVVLSEKRVATLPNCTHFDRSRVSEFPYVHLVRPLRPGRDAARTGRAAASRSREGGRRSEAAPADGGCRHGSMARRSRGDGEAPAQRNGALCEGNRGSGDQEGRFVITPP